MELNISDLLDDMQDVPMDISAESPIRENQVFALTMKKVSRRTELTSGRTGRYLGKAVLVAAALLCLSVTVLAAVTEYIPRWLDTSTEETVGYDNDLYIGAFSKNWDMQGWLLELKAEAVNTTGLTVVCTEWAEQAQKGTLVADSDYWLEKWNGSGYTIYMPEIISDSSEKDITIQRNSACSWSINWEGSYGTLAPGSYRLGMNFRHTSESGQVSSMPGYVKFKVFEGNKGELYAQYEAALKALALQDGWHLTWQVFPEAPGWYASYSMEIWKDGDNYLEHLQYLDPDGTVIRQSGSALYKGKGYRLIWEDGSTDTGVTRCKADSTVQSSIFRYWETFLELSDARISEIAKEGNVIAFKEYDDATNWETVLTVNEAGQIASVQRYRICEGNRSLCNSLTVHDTDAMLIAQTIDAVNPEALTAE